MESFVTRAVRRFIVFVTAIKTVVIQGKAYDEPSMFNLANTKIPNWLLQLINCYHLWTSLWSGMRFVKFKIIL